MIYLWTHIVFPFVSTVNVIYIIVPTKLNWTAFDGNCTKLRTQFNSDFSKKYLYV